MPDEKNDQPTRQIYASIREDLYLAAKARATELRMPLRRFIEEALELALSGQAAARQTQQVTAPSRSPSVWDDEYLRVQARQAVGSPIELSREEAERVVRASFGSEPANERNARDG